MEDDRIYCPLCGGGVEVEFTGEASFRACCLLGCDLGIVELSWLRHDLYDAGYRRPWKIGRQIQLFTDT